MSNTNEKMNRLREKLLDAALEGTAEEARLYAEALGMMPQEDPILKVGVPEPKAGDDEALAKCVKLAKEALAQQGWVVLDCQPEHPGETLHRMKKEGLDLFMAQGFPSFGEMLATVLRNRPLSRDALSRSMGFPDHLMGARAHAVWVECQRSDDSFVAEFRWNAKANPTSSARLPDTISGEVLREFACARDGLAFKMFTGKSPESATANEVVGWINEANLYLAFAEWEGLSRSKVSDPAKSSEEKAYWFVPNAPMVLTTGTHLVYGEGGDFETKSAIGGASASRSPIPLRAKSLWTKSGKACLYQRTAESAPGRVFDCLVSAKAHLAEMPAPKKTGDWLNPVEADAIGRPSFHGNYTAEKPAASDPGHAATHWFVPAAPFKANGDGLGVTSPDGATQFYTLASDRKVDRSPVPLRIKSGIVPPVIFGTWRLYRPGSSVAGAIFETFEEAMEHAALSEAPAPKKVRYGLLDASIAGPSALTIVETADGIPVAITVRTFSPGPLLGTMLYVVAMCFRLGITDLYGDSYREKEVTHALATIATFLRGEALHDLSEGDRASFLRTTTTIEWPRAYTIPTFKALPPLS